MNTPEAIRGRRSIRRFSPRPIPREQIETLLDLTVQAPSAKNAQPWRFVVLEGEAHQELIRLMRSAVAEFRKRGLDAGSCEGTCNAMSKASVTIIFFDVMMPAGIPQEAFDDYHFVMLQSIGGAIQTLLLAAHDMGLGSLWICDVLYAGDAVKAWLGHESDVLVAAVTLGYADESPGPRPRMPWRDVTEWRGPSPEESLGRYDSA